MWISYCDKYRANDKLIQKFPYHYMLAYVPDGGDGAWLPAKGIFQIQKELDFGINFNSDFEWESAFSYEQSTSLMRATSYWREVAGLDSWARPSYEDPFIKTKLTLQEFLNKPWVYILKSSRERAAIFAGSK